MKALLRNPWFWRVVGALLFGIIVWFVGPLIAIGGWRPFGWWPVTALFALLALLGVVGYWLWARGRDKRRNAALMDALAPTSRGDGDELSAKLNEALTMLRSTKLGTRGTYVYQLPWYAIIGPSGAGKTTALLNSGLGFPTAVAGEYRALRGQPKTPNCDWWFTDEAVLIDTAGRYVTQDDDATADAEGWKGFLALLKQHRPLQPLNGVIVAIPAPDFADARKMASHAENIRARLAEIGTSLGQALPIYVLVTKTDLLAGFREYFARATDAESDQVFGATAPGEGADNAAVLQGFDKLVNSVAARVVDRMQNEAELPRRGQIAAFPAQLASLRAPLAELLSALGQKSRFDTPARVRGVYLASGTQTGNPVDRILLTVGMPAMASTSAVGQGRSYFLKRFFSDLVFPEQGLASRNAAAEKKARQRYLVGVGGGVAALVIAIGVWGWGYVRNTALIRGVYETTAAYAQAAGIARGGTASASEDLAALGVLGKATGDMAAASDFGLGLGQGGRLGAELKAIYGRDLQRRLTPILAGLAEDRIAADSANPPLLYDDLKSYLVLGGRGPLLPQQVTGWVQPAWTARGGGGDVAAEASELVRHTAALFDGNFKPVAVDATRIDRAREVLRAQPPAVRVYGRLKSKAMEAGEPIWTARENAGPRPEIFFASSGAFAPGSGIPALFTRKGYDTIFLPMLASGPKLLEEEAWVVGDSGAATVVPDMAGLKRDLEQLYFAEFLQRWRGYFAGMQPRPATSLADNVQRLRDGSGPLSPLPPLLKAAAQASDMTPSKGAAKVGALGGAMGGKLMGAVGMGPGGNDAREAVTAAFLPLRMFVGIPPGGGPPAPNAPLDLMLSGMGQLADKLNIISVLPGGGGETGSAASLEVRALISQLDQTANAMPEPAGVIAKAIASDANVALGGARTAQMGAALDASFGSQCAEVVAKAFPVQPAAQAEISLPDFSRFFAPQGTLAKFVSQELAGYVDTSGPEWQARPNAGEIGLTEANVRALQAASLVTRTFFASDPQAPRLVYQLEPVALAGAKTVSLKIDGQVLKYDGKAAVPATFEWPGAGGAAVEFGVEGSSVPAVRTWPGQWALFRLMKAAAVRAGATPSAGEGSLTEGGARFDFRVRTFVAGNPFVVDPFIKIACPARITTGVGTTPVAG
ncbi:type VI secretion system membrane subunit TssM [Sandarakinorhabdus sp. DWP1-3-1]|uniref:type VI secretion system membrane subunit TssM n=1 Tax=Sandarakinorhabdus sp. DWP1-3-1 TaxID=2804627 RepID=UPI003CECA0A8